MDTSLKKLPAGIQTFADIREDGYIYVDKTKYLVDMIDSGKIYFLSRPRRFGKSLTCSTFEAIFRGRKELFEGLYAEEFLNRPGFKPSPIIRLNMNGVTTSGGLEEMKKSIIFTVGLVADKLEVTLQKGLTHGHILQELIIETYKKYGERAVLLVDEYDKPYTDFFNEPDMANKARDILRDFYTQIKVCEEYLRFIFITGIAKTAKMGVFSTLNNLTDISLDENYGEICGLTDEELYKYFTPHLEQAAIKKKMTFEDFMAKVENYYDGFCFDGEHYLYNPHSFLLFLRQKDFISYWISTGMSKFLADYLKNRNLTVEQFKGLQVSKDFIYNPPAEIEVAPPESFLYQSGYLSLRPGIKDDYGLDYTNTEVLNTMSRLLTQNILSHKNESELRYSSDLKSALYDKDIEGIIDVFNRLLASIPHNDFDGAAKQDIKYKGYKMTAQEWLCRSCLLAFVRGCGVVVAGEVQTNKGRTDLVIEHKGNYFIIEIKMSPRHTAKDALQQIIDNGYALPYPDAISLGLAIDEKKRQIEEWIVA